MNQPCTLSRVEPVDVKHYDGFDIEAAFLHFDDALGRPIALYAARCVPVSDQPRPAVVHLPGGGQTVQNIDIAWWARHGFACGSLDWQIGDFPAHDPNRKTRWPDGMQNQNGDAAREQDCVLPFAAQGAGVVIDWLSQHDGVDENRIGVAGISWGGFLTWLVNAVEPRCKAAVPVYGCGGLFEDDHFHRRKNEWPIAATYRGEWDASSLGDRQQGPVCWLSSTNDFFGYHTFANSLLDSLTVDRRRSAHPNTNHHIGPGGAAAGLAWMKHYLADGPALPPEPLLRDDLTIDAGAAADDVTSTELWWSADDSTLGSDQYVRDDMRCWRPGTPDDPATVRQAFGRVTYTSGVVLNTPLRPFDATHALPPVGDTWPRIADGVAPYWGLISTQFHFPQVDIDPVEGDAARSRWAVARDGEGPIAVAFRGMADRTWNDGEFDAIDVGLTFDGDAPATLSIMLHVIMPDGTQAEMPREVAVEKAGDGHVIRATLDGLAKLPDGATWRNIFLLVVNGQIPGNTFTFGPVCKVRTNA